MAEGPFQSEACTAWFRSAGRGLPDGRGEEMRIAFDAATALSVFTAWRLMGEMNGLPLRSWTRFAAGFLMLMLSLDIGDPDHHRTWHEIAQGSASFILLALGAVQACGGLAQGAVEVWNWVHLKWAGLSDRSPVALFATLGASLSRADRGTVMDLLLFGVPLSLCLVCETLPPRLLRGAGPALDWVSTALLWAWIVSGYIRKSRPSGPKP